MSDLVDRKFVSRKIRQVIWPILKADGFTDTTATTAWRCLPDRIDIVNFQMMGAHLASHLETTTFSFAINLAIYFRFIPCDSLLNRQKTVKGRPPEYCGQFRKSINPPGLFQADSNPDVWFVSLDKFGLDLMFNEVKIRVAAEAMPWFEKYGDLDVAYERTRMYEDEDNWGYGTPDSPHACLIRGYIGLRLGKEEGKEDLQLALESGCFASLAAEIEAYLQTKEV